MRAERICSPYGRQLEVTAYAGHFASPHAHSSHYLDITPIKHCHLTARASAMELAERYALMRNVDTVLCLDGSDVVGAFLARHLAKKDLISLNSDKNIAVVAPERGSEGQMLLRDNLVGMVRDKDVLPLISTIHTGRTARQALEGVAYYGGRVSAVTAIFSAVEAVDGVPVFALFTPTDIPGFVTGAPEACPLCAAGVKLDALVNSYGLSQLE